MSILIASLETNQRVVLYADRRLITEHANISSGEYVSSETQKIFHLSANLACGCTGDCQWGIQLAQDLLKNIDRLPSELIEIVRKHPLPETIQCTFSLVGKYDDGDLFLYGIMTKGGESFLKNEPGTLIATSPPELLEKCFDFFNKKKKAKLSVHLCCEDTIKFAANLDKKYISYEMDFIELLV